MIVRPTPRVILVLVVLISAAGMLSAVWLSMSQPWMGLSLMPTETDGLRVDRVFARSPAAAAGLVAGTRIVSMEAAGRHVDLEPVDLLEEPDFSPTYEQFNRFMHRQGEIRGLLQGESLTLISADETAYELRPLPKRPLDVLPAAFWFQLAFGVLCLGIGSAVWAYRRDRATALFASSAFGLYVVGITAAVYSTRELAMAEPMFVALAAGNHAGGMLFGASFVGLLLNYPNRLVSGHFVLALIGVYMVLWVLECLQWLPSMELGFRLPLMAALLATVFIAAAQWRRIDDPGDRVAFRWFVFPLFVGASLFQGVLFVPLLLGMQPLMPQSYAFGLLLLIFAGMAVGVARYGLFQLQRLWYPALAGSTALIVGIILLPVISRFSNLSQIGAIATTLAMLGWVYFPLHGWLRSRRNEQWRARAVPILGEGVRVLLDPERKGDTRRLWQALVQQVFRPLEIEEVTEGPDTPEISNDGSVLRLPGSGQAGAVELHWPDSGTRLFDDSDLRLANAILPLASHAWDIRNAWEAGGRAERNRLKADLEDDLGARIYTQILRAPEEQVAATQRAALAEVRLVIDQLEAGTRPLSECLSEWEAQIADYCDLAAVSLSWTIHGTLPDEQLHATARANPLRILREVLANAIQHAHPTHIEVAVTVDFPHLVLDVTHDGATVSPADWPSGRGMLNIRARVRQLRGEITWREANEGEIQMRSELNLKDADGPEHG